MVSGRLPGAVIGQVFRAGTGTTRSFPRFAGFIAKGLDIKLFRDTEIVRGSVEGVQLSFSSTTYTASLSFSAIPDKTRARLYMSDGRTVAPTRWSFAESVLGSGTYDTVLIDPAIFASSTSYFFDYISNDPLWQDEIPVDNLRELIRVGDGAGQSKYIEGTDFNTPATVVGPDAGTSNAFAATRGVSSITTHASNSVTGNNTAPNAVITFNSSSYNHDYSRNYQIEVTAAAGTVGSRTATLVISAFPVSSGNEASLPRSAALLNQITVNLVEATPASLTGVAAEFGVTLDFAFGTSGNFVLGDKYAYTGLGLGKLEVDGRLLNTNQFAAVSAVQNTAVTGQGTIAINAQSEFTGTDNQTYEVEVVSASGTAPNRQVQLMYRTNPKLKKLTGTVTATNASAALTGTGTQFLTELAVGDRLFIAALGFHVEVLSIASNTAATLTAVFPFPTQTGVAALRYRQQSGTLATLTESVSTLNRVTLDSGIFIDVAFGDVAPTDNFVVGDTFTFEAKPARLTYSAKENRSYDISVTAVATNHGITASYSGDTVDALFGTATLSEGNPLVLPNNMIVHARNTSIAPRYTASPADTFDMSVTLDGTIDWNLQKENIETISTSNVLRDLTGSRTGTVGAYYVQLRKKPDSVVYVRGPSPTFTDVPFNTVANTQIVWFTTAPTSTLTIKYLTAGAEPSAGRTYFMTGYAKRPDTDYLKPQLFTSRDEARAFLAPMTEFNDAAIANEIAWEQDEQNLPGVVVVLVKDSDGDGRFTTADYTEAIRISEETKSLVDLVTVNQFDAREEFRDSVVNMNDPTVARRRVGYNGFPVDYPIGDEFTAGSRVYVARRELQVFEETVARGSLAIIGNSYARKTILVDALGDGNIDSIPTQVTLDGSFLAVALAARVASFNEPWQTVYGLPVSGFDEIESLTETQMITLQDAGIICLRVEGGTARYVGTMTTDRTEPSTEQLSGTIQRQYVLTRLQNAIESRVIGYVAESPEDAAQFLASEIVAELASMVSEGKIGSYTDDNGNVRPIDPATDVVAFRDRRNPTRSYFKASWRNKYATLFVDGVVAVDAPTP